MDQARWNQIEDLLQAALDLDTHERGPFLLRTCGSDRALLHELEGLLGEESEAIVLESPAISNIAESLTGSDLAGQQISHYRIERKIGAGGMGDVYEAHDARLLRTVALKALPAEFAGDHERVRRFEQEAFAASRLNHPNIITIFEVVHSGEGHFIAAERIEGTTLRDMLTRPESRAQRALPVQQALDIVMQTAAALKAAHTAWIIHRDIKPENIMVRSDGLVKVVDFGIAKLGDDDSNGPESFSGPAPRPHVTAAGAILGTATYMSPEQARGDPLDGRTDLFSLGLVLYEMVTGRKFVRATSALDEIRGELAPILRKMLQEDREDRYASAADLLGDLARVKRRLEGRRARTMIAISAAALVVAIAIAGLAAILSVNEVWDERVLRDGHTAAVRQAAISPDGSVLASCGEDGRIILWDFVRRRRLGTLPGPAAHKLVFSPDGRWLATGGVDGAITIWDVASRRKVQILSAHPDEIGMVAFSPDSSMLVSGASSAFVSQTILWDTRQWKKIREWPVPSAHGTAHFSRDHRQLLVSHELTLLDLVTGESTPHAPGVSINWMAASADGTRLASIDTMGNASLYTFPIDGRLSAPLLVSSVRGHHDHGRAVAFSPDGSVFATGADDLVLWDGVSGRQIARFEYPSIVWSATFSPDGQWLVSTHGDGAILIWNLVDKQLAWNVNEHRGAVRSVAFEPGGRRVASAGDDRTVTLWNLDGGEKSAIFTDHRTRVNAVFFSADGSRLVSADQDGVIVMREVEAREPVLSRRLSGTWPLYTSAISPDGRFIVGSGGLYDPNGRLVLDLEQSAGRHIGHAYGAAFSDDGRRLALVTDRGLLLIIDAMNPAILDLQRVAAKSQIAVDFSPDGERLVVGDDSGAVRIWSAKPLREMAVVGRHGARVKSVAFHPDGKTVASAGDDRLIALWDIGRRKLRSRIGTHASPVYAIAFSRDGRRLVSGEHDHSVRVYSRRRMLWGMQLE